MHGVTAFADLSKEAQEKIRTLRQKENIVGLSGGKDSMATEEQLKEFYERICEK